MEELFSKIMDISGSKFLELHLVIGDAPFPVASVLVDEHTASVLVLPEDGYINRHYFNHFWRSEIIRNTNFMASTGRGRQTTKIKSEIEKKGGRRKIIRYVF